MSDEMKKSTEQPQVDPTEIPEDQFLKSLAVIEEIAKGDFETDLEKAKKKGLKAESEGGDEENIGEDETSEDEAKSFADDIREGEEIRKAVEVSDFLSELVDRIVDKMDIFEERIQKVEKSMVAASEINKSLATELINSLSTLSKGIAASKDGLEDLKKSIGEYNSQPAHSRKSQIRVLEKSFGGEDSGGDMNLSKAQIADRLVDMVIKGVDGVTAQDVVRFNTDGHLSPEVIRRLQSK